MCGPVFIKNKLPSCKPHNKKHKPFNVKVCDLAKSLSQPAKSVLRFQAQLKSYLNLFLKHNYT